MMTLLIKVRRNGWLTQKKRWAELGKAEKILLEDDVALVPLYQNARSYVMKPNVKGIVKHNISPEYSFKWAYVEEK
ncbi:hypothetical protein ACT7CU_11665 [Bacillus paranthracis]